MGWEGREIQVRNRMFSFTNWNYTMDVQMLSVTAVSLHNIFVAFSILSGFTVKSLYKGFA